MRAVETGHVILAETFASSTAGYIVGIGVPVLCLLIAGLVVRYERSQAKVTTRLDQLGAALTENTQGLALLVQQSNADRGNLARVPDLETAVAVLRDRLDRHEQHSAAEHERLRDATLMAWAGQSSRPPAQRPFPRPSAGH